jgi:hypothetical protein
MIVRPNHPTMAEAYQSRNRAPRRRARLRVVTPRGASLTVDVGEGGFSTAVMRVVPVSTRFEGTIHYAGRDESFTGRVVWAKPGNARLGVAGAMGVCFERVSPPFARELACPQPGESPNA